MLTDVVVFSHVPAHPLRKAIGAHLAHACVEYDHSEVVGEPWDIKDLIF